MLTVNLRLRNIMNNGTTVLSYFHKLSSFQL